ncbi:large ribosomal subunit protein bL17m-like [Asterias amurensis]|uniref:large ribosomal subunit protein bL17m-like n=1 Tax=Asterias amurensis TaxID=7602 RepID=UPI003AB5DE0B
MRHGKIYRRVAGGPKQRINLLRHLVTTLVKFERLEAPYGKAHETQKYAERLINIAKRGDTDEEAMKIADFWLSEKRQVHKLFKVLAPRFASRQSNYTQLHRVPGYEGERNIAMSFLEYRGNPYPPLQPIKKKNPNWILNILIREGIKDLKATGALQGAGNHFKVTASNNGSTELKGLETSLGDLQLGVSQEGAVDDKQVNALKDGTPV